MSKDVLTPAERRVANLVSKGLSNLAIANQLFVSRNTVETHLRNINKKMGRGPDDTPPAAAAALRRS
jgi:DNA-binding CsgD family transcriptional regulator